MHTILIFVDSLPSDEKKQHDLKFSSLLKYHQFYRRLSIPFSGNFFTIGTLGDDGVSGSDNNHFNSPFDIIKVDNFILITDTMNERIQIFERNLFCFTLNLMKSSLKCKPKRIQKSDDGVFVTIEFDYGFSLLIKLNRKALIERLCKLIKEGVNNMIIHFDNSDDLIMWKLEYEEDILALQQVTLQSEKLLLVSTSTNIHLIQSSNGQFFREFFNETICNDLRIFQVENNINLLGVGDNRIMIFDLNIGTPPIPFTLQSIIYPTSYDHSFGVAINEGLNIRNICSRDFLRSGLVKPTRNVIKEVQSHKQIILSQSPSNKLHIFDLFLMKKTENGKITLEWDYELVKTFGKKPLFNYPTNLLIDEYGNLFVVNSKNHSIKIFR